MVRQPQPSTLEPQLSRLRLSVAVLVLAFAGSACSTTEAGHGTLAGPSTFPSVTSSSSSSGASSAAATPTADGLVLQQIALKVSDMTVGYTFGLIDGGDQVADEVTLDNCGYDFTTESHRVARRQYAAEDTSGGYTGLSNELAAYDTVAEAVKALAQWHTSASSCPTTPVTSSVSGDPATAYTVLSNDVGVAGLPVPSNAVTVESQASSDGTFVEITMLQQKGRYVDIVYIDSDSAPSASDLALAEQVASITGRRLAGVS
jgi:hypothetical protein